MFRFTSFKDVIENVYGADIFNSVAEYIESNPDKIDGISKSIYSFNEAALYGIEIKSIGNIREDKNKILFDVIISAEIKISKTISRNYETDSIEQWLRVSCSVDERLNNFKVHEIYTYIKNRIDSKNSLSEYLIPIISKEQLDDVAEGFLEKYYPEALEKPMAVPACVVARRMGLNIKEVHITKTSSVFGQIYFSDCETQYYDSDTGTYKNLSIKEGTMLVDPSVYFMRSVGSMNNTIIHECIHWEKHRKFFELEKIYNIDFNSISCQVQEGTIAETNRSPLDWMEWQANALAPRILMPAKQTRLKIDELIDKYKSDNIADTMQLVVLELSEFFKVSRLAAKIRMIDLGYKEAIGVLTYIDDRYISNYAFDCDALKDNQTFAIGIQDALIEYALNEEFRKLIDSGKYLYVDAHFCINNPKYIYLNESGTAELTNYARQHIDECCLVFDISSRKNSKYGSKNYSECVLFRNIISDTIVEANYNNSSQNASTEARALELNKLAEKVKQIKEIKCCLPPTFCDTLVAHMKRQKYTNERLSEYSNVGTRTIERMRSDENYQTTLGTVVALCIGLKLHPILSQDLIQKAGYKFKNTEEHIAYQLLLGSYYENSIHECNEVLKSNNFTLLGKEQ